MWESGWVSGTSISRRQLLVGIGAACAAAQVKLGIGRGETAGADAAGPLVQVQPGTSLGRLDVRSLGFSFERSTLPLSLFDDANADLVGLFRLLGPGLLRVGAKTVDTTPWNAVGPGRTAGSVAPADVAALRRFADATDWDVLHGLPFVHADASPASAAAEAEAVAVTLGDRLAAYEFGNEPDLYAINSAYAPLAGTLGLCKARWEAFAASVHAADPATPLTGPGCCLLQSIDGWASPFVAVESTGLVAVTQHYYRGFGGSGQTIDLLLGPDPVLDSSLAKLGSLEKLLSPGPNPSLAAAGLGGFRFTETNSFASGGQPGVSNSFASALWALGLHLDVTAAGGGGCNFHNSGSGAGYPAIVQVGGTVTEVRPLFYGLLLLASLGTGTHLATISQRLPATIRVSALRGDDGDFRVVIQNLDPEAAVRVDIDLATPLAGASLALLEAPSLDATSGVTFQGAPVGIDGTWEPLAEDDIAVSGSTLTVTVPAVGAAVVRARPAPPVASTTSMAAVTMVHTEPTSPASTIRPAVSARQATEWRDMPEHASAAPAVAVRSAPSYTG